MTVTEEKPRTVVFGEAREGWAREGIGLPDRSQKSDTIILYP